MSILTDYRPSNFGEFLGNKEVVNQLLSSGKKEKLPHCLLFHGPKGHGKTTIARIIANMIASEHGLFEFNTANTRGIDTAREIINNLHFKAVDGSNKVYILDEVHKTTNEFQNALLKATEEPPEHVYFILCTTEPDKILPTLKERCTAFPMKALDEEDSKLLIRKVCKAEQIKLSQEMINLIIDEGEGSPRRILKIIEIAQNTDSTKEVLRLIGDISIDNKEVLNLCKALTKENNWKTVSKLVGKIKDDPEQVRRSVLGYMSSVLLNSKKKNNHVPIVMECFEDNFYDSGKPGLILACYRAYH